MKFRQLSAVIARAALLLSVLAAAVPVRGRDVFNLNPDWRFWRADVPQAANPDFDDSSWAHVSLPHTWNDVDTFDNFGRGGHQGESDLWTGVAWYRKEFTLPASDAGKRVYIEFEGVRQIAAVFLNGHRLGVNKTGFIPFGFDLTPYLKFGGRNVLAVSADNRFDPMFQGDQPWNFPNWHPPHGGIYRNVRLHVVDALHVTLPLYSNLQTEGIYARTTSLTRDRAEVKITAEVENGTPAQVDATVTLSLVDRQGRIAGSTVVSAALSAGERGKVTGTVAVRDPQLWEPAYPYVYSVQATVAAGGTVHDVATTDFGIRAFRFDAQTGFWINGHPVKLHGWGQKPTQAWAGLGAALPDWLADYTLRQMADAGGNMIRWGHCAGSVAALADGDKYGFVTLMPGVDGEHDCDGAAWRTRAAAFRDMIIYFRNHPSICVWEGGNYNVSVAHARELREMVDRWDPDGLRYFGFRMATPAMRPYIDIEIGTVGRVRAHPYLPVLEAEYDRTESPRRVWDAFSPPDFGHLGPREAENTYHVDQEGFAVNAVKEWWTLFGSKPDHSGGANWIFSDGPHGSRSVTDVARTSGEVDGVRLPKEAYWALQAIWAAPERVHLIGHWTYPAGTVKTMYAVARADTAELFVNGRSLGRGERSLDTLFTWKNVAFEPGQVRVVAYRAGKAIAEQTKQTAGPAVALRLTPLVAPGGWRADGSDVALIDCEVVDAKGQRCPTDQARVDFDLTGPGIWRGGYNSGQEHSTNNRYLDTECGINRVSVRSTLQAGAVTVTARRAGLKSATLTLRSAALRLTGGLSTAAPANFAATLGPRPAVRDDALRALAAARRIPARPPALTAAAAERDFSTFAYTGDGAAGTEDVQTLNCLAYADDALLYLDRLPPVLEGARLLRTANGDRAYWANDYIVATAARDLDVFVAHDGRAPVPGWLQTYRKTGDTVAVNGHALALFRLPLKAGETLRIPGNIDPGQRVGPAYNLVIFSRPAAPPASRRSPATRP